MERMLDLKCPPVTVPACREHVSSRGTEFLERRLLHLMKRKPFPQNAGRLDAVGFYPVSSLEDCPRHAGFDRAVCP